MEKEKLIKPSEAAIILVIFILAVLIVIGFYFSLYSKIKEKLYLLREEIKLSRQQTLSTITPTLTSEPAAVEWEIYRNDKIGFEFKYPKSWNIAVYNSGDNITLSNEPKREENIPPEPEEERKYVFITIETYYLEGGTEKSFVYPYYKDCLPSQDSFISPNTPPKDRLFCRCRLFTRLPDNVPFIRTKDEIKELSINNLSVIHCDWTLFDIFLRENVIMQWTFHRPKAAGFIDKFDSILYEIIYSLKRID